MSAKKIMLDASALLALLNEETGHKMVEETLSEAMMSSVNLTEVISVLTDIGISQQDAENMATDLINEIIPFDQSQAFIAASLRKHKKYHGLSLGDRACLALSISQNAITLTADRIWEKLHINGIKIKLIR